jgi:hypothetical protein
VGRVRLPDAGAAVIALDVDPISQGCLLAWVMSAGIVALGLKLRRRR